MEDTAGRIEQHIAQRSSALGELCSEEERVAAALEKVDHVEHAVERLRMQLEDILSLEMMARPLTEEPEYPLQLEVEVERKSFFARRSTGAVIYGLTIACVALGLYKRWKRAT